MRKNNRCRQRISISKVEVSDVKEKKKNRWEPTPFGVKVKKRLIEKNMTVSDLARMLGINRSFLSQMLYGNKKGEKYIPAICNALDIKESKRKKAA